MACLLRRNNGIYYVVRVRKGRRVWLSLRTRDESIAKHLFDESEQECQYQRMFPMSSFSDEIFRSAALSLHARTVGMYASAFRNLIRILGDRPVKRIKPMDIERFKKIRSEEVSAVSTNIEIRTLRAAFNQGVRLKLLDDNPLDGVRQIRVPYKEAKFLTESEFWGLVESIDDQQFKDLVTFAVFTMMRQGEILQLHRQDVDLARRVIHVRNSDTFRVKGGKPRIVPMNDWIFEFLRSRVGQEGEFVFAGAKGKPLDGHRISKKFKAYIRKSGLDDSLHFHSLRHTGISWLMNRGVAPQHVQHIAGHSSLQVTGIYTHMVDANLLAAVNAFGPLPPN